MIFGKGVHKYKAVRTTFEGRSFASKLEANLYAILLLRERAGEINAIVCQPRVRFHTHDYGWIRMVPDFSFVDSVSGTEIYAEAKGVETREWLRKKKAWAEGGPARMEVWKAKGGRPSLVDEITPKWISRAAPK